MGDLTRRRFLAAGGGAAGLMALGVGGFELLDSGDSKPRARRDAPNVVVVVIDNLRTDHVGAYGGTRARTPNIDALARQSLRFTRARPEAFPTVSARRAIMTGRRSFPFADWHPEPPLPEEPGWQSIPDDETTFLELLGEQGYTTAYVTDNPWILSKPFDGFMNSVDIARTIHGEVPLRHSPRGTVPMEEVQHKVLPQLRGTVVEARLREFLTANAGRRGEQDYLAARVFRAASAWLERARRERPFALVVDTFAPHEAWDPPPSYIGLYGEPERASPEPILPFLPPGKTVEQMRLSEDDVARTGELYAAEVTLTDRWLGHFLDRLEALRLADDTVLIVLSDHGVLLGERGFIGKHGSQSHREIVDVPYFIRHPGGRGAGRTSDYFASTHDVAPTLLSMLGITPPEEMEGNDLTPALSGREPRRRGYFTASYGYYVLAGDGRFLLISNGKGTQRRLYDGEADPSELTDVASANPQTTDQLWKRILDDAGGKLPRFGPEGAI